MVAPVLSAGSWAPFAAGNSTNPAFMACLLHEATVTSSLVESWSKKCAAWFMVMGWLEETRRDQSQLLAQLEGLCYCSRAAGTALGDL